MNQILQRARSQNASAVDLQAGKIKVRNWFDFINARDIAEGTWEVKAEDKTIASGKLPELDIEPHQEKEYSIPLSSVKAESDVEYILNITFVLKKDLPWAKKGHEISWEQLLMSSGVKPLPDKAEYPPLTVDDARDRTRISGPDFALTFDKQSGLITKYFYKGYLLLERGPQPDFWRAMTDNDIGAWRNIETSKVKNPLLDVSLWREQGSAWKIREVQVQRIDDCRAKIVVSGDLSAVGGQYAITYIVFGNGEVEVEGSYLPGKGQIAMMPRFGMEMIVAPGFETITWYGRGPAPTYTDRDYEKVGVYRSTIDGQWNEYSQPQENSNKVDVRWVTLTNKNGIGLRATGVPVLSVSAYHYPKSEIEQADYTFKMTRRPQIYLNLDLRQMGIGGVNSWTPNAYPLDPYRIRGDQPYSYKYLLTPIQ